MRFFYSSEYHSNCVMLDGRESAAEVIHECIRVNATCYESPGDPDACMVVMFPGSVPQLYTKNALARSLPLKPVVA